MPYVPYQRTKLTTDVQDFADFLFISSNDAFKFYIFTISAYFVYQVEGIDDCSDGDWIAHEYDCQKYYRCVHGKLVEQTCGPGRFFNISINNCNYEHSG